MSAALSPCTASVEEALQQRQLRALLKYQPSTTLKQSYSLQINSTVLRYQILLRPLIDPTYIPRPLIVMKATVMRAISLHKCYLNCCSVSHLLYSIYLGTQRFKPTIKQYFIFRRTRRNLDFSGVSELFS